MTRVTSWPRGLSFGPVARLFSFPNPVNEVSSRLVAGGVVLLALTIIIFDQPWLTALLAYGFVARVLTGRADVRSVVVLDFVLVVMTSTATNMSSRSPIPVARNSDTGRIGATRP